MTMPDDSQDTAGSDLSSPDMPSPQDAARNLAEAKVVGVDPDTYAQTRQAHIDTAKQVAQTTATPKVQEAASENQQKRALFQKDTEKLSMFERYSAFASDALGAQSTTRDISDLSFRQLNGEKLSTEDKFKWTELNNRLRSYHSSDDYGYNFWESLPVDVAVGAKDWIQGLFEHKKTILGAAAAGTATGAAAGLAGGAIASVVIGPEAIGEGVKQGAIEGLKTGTSLGVLAAGLQDNYKQGASQVYSDLTFGNVKNLSVEAEEDRKAIAKGTGALMSAIGFATHLGISKTVPWLSKFGSRVASGTESSTTALATNVALKTLASPENKQWLTLVKSLGQSSLTGAIGGGSQEAVKILGEAIGGDYDGSEKGFIDRMSNAIAKWNSLDSERVLKAAATTAVQAPAITLGSHIIEQGTKAGAKSAAVAGANAVFESPENLRSKAADTLGTFEGLKQKVGKAVNDAVGGKGSASNPEVITPEQAPRGNEKASSAGEPGQIIDVEPTRPPTDVRSVNPDLPYGTRGSKAIQLSIALRQMSDVTKDTEVKTHAPDELTQLRRHVLEDSQIPFIYVDREDMNKISSKPDKAEKVRKILDKYGVFAAQEANAPLRISTHDWLNIVDDHPEAAGMAKLAPEDMSAKQYLESIEQKKQQRVEMFGKSAPQVQDLSHITDPKLKNAVGNRANFVAKDGQTYTFKMEPNPPYKQGVNEFTVRAYDDQGNEVGNTSADDFHIHQDSDKGKYQTTNVSVDEAHRRKGLATGMYDFIQANGIKIAEKGGHRNDDGVAFRKSYDDREKAMSGESAAVTSLNTTKLRTAVENTEARITELSTNEDAQNEYIKNKWNRADDLLYAKEAIDSAKFPLEKQSAQEHYDNLKEEALDNLFEHVERMKMNVAFKKLQIATQESKLAKPKRTEFQMERPAGNVEPRTQDADIHNEADYLNQPSFTEAMKDKLSPKEIAKFDESQRKARTEVIEAINDSAKHEMDQVIDLITEIDSNIHNEEAAQQVENDPNVQIVEDFINNKVKGELTINQRMRRSKSAPIWAIDPNSLPSELRNRFIDDQALKSRRVFARGGMDLEVVAQALEARDGEHLLEVLSKTPTREQAMAKATEIRAVAARIEAADSVDLNHTAIAKAYNNMTRNHVREMKFLRETDWGSVKQGIKRIALPLPRIDVLQQKAFDHIMSTPIRELNPNQWKVGERRSQREAVQAILNNEVETAFRKKEAAALNSQLAKETHITIGKVNRAVKKIARFTDRKGMAVLDKAGPLYMNAIQEYLALYRFDPSMKRINAVDGVRKFADKMMREGQGNEKLPDNALQWMDDRISYKELSAEQFLYVANQIEAIFKQAQMKNELKGKYEERGRQQTMEMLAAAATESVKDHPDRNENKIDIAQGDLSSGQRAARVWSNIEGLIKNTQFLTLELDRGNYGGFWSRMIHQRLRGIGPWEHTGEGFSAVTKMQHEVHKKFTKAIKAFGPSDFGQLGIHARYVPEFADIKALSNGNLTLLDLHEMAKHLGNEDNRKALTNFGPSIEVFMKVIERELSPKHLEYIRDAIGSTFKGLAPNVVALEKKTTGRDLELTKPSGFTMFGQEWEGWHYPIKYKRDVNSKALEDLNTRRLESADGGKKVFFDPQAPWNGVVASPHTKERVGSDWHLSLEPQTTSAGIEESIYDLAMRVPVADTMKFVNHPEVGKAGKSVLGPVKWNILVNSVAESTRSVFVDSLNLYGDQSRFVNGALKTVQGVAGITQIAGNLATMLIHFSSIPVVIGKMGGINGSKHFANALLKVSSPLNWNKLGEMNKAVSEIDPQLERRLLGLDDHTFHAIDNLLPKKRYVTNPKLGANKAYNVARKAQEITNEVAISHILGAINATMQKATALAAYNQFMAGEAPGHSWEKVIAMNEDERHAAAKAYAAELNSSTFMSASFMDRAVLQKLPATQLFTYFWNISRNTLNSNIQSTRNVKYALKEGVSAGKEGEYGEAAGKFWDAGTRGTSLLFATIIGLIIHSMVRGKNPVQDEDDDRDLGAAKTMDKLPAWVWKQMTTVEGWARLAGEAFGQYTPGVREAMYASQRMTKRGTVSIQDPVTGMVADSVIAGHAGYQLYTNWQDFRNFNDIYESLSPAQVRAMLSTTSLLMGGIPANAGAKTKEYIDEKNYNNEKILPDGKKIVGGTIVALGAIIKMFDHEKPWKEMTAEEKFQKIAADAREHKPETQQVADQAKELRSQLDTTNPREILNQHEVDMIRYAESGNRWNAQPTDKEGKPVGTAFGIYQFLNSTWMNIVKGPVDKKKGTRQANQRPTVDGMTIDQFPPVDVVITPRSRFEKDPRYQEKMFRFLTAYNARQLEDRDVPVNVNSLYTAWHFGPRVASQVYAADDKAKITAVLGSKAIKNNPQLKHVKTAAELKTYIANALARGERAFNRDHEDDEDEADD